MIEKPVGVFVSGYQIFRAYKLDESGDDQPNNTKYGYRLVGPRKQEFFLARVSSKPHILLAFDLEKRIIAEPFKGSFFSDQNTELVIAKQG